MSARSLKCLIRMWGLMFIVCTLLPSLMCKEHSPTVDVSEDEKNMIYKIMKRLEMNDKRSQPSRLRNGEGDSTTTTGRPSTSSTRSSESESIGAESESCVSQLNVRTNKETIIRTEDSITNGAVFLGEFPFVASNEICVDHCCKNSSCDTAVFENKGKRHCYLFQCQEKCEFDQHGSYVSTEIVRSAPSPSSPAPIADHSEDDADLANSDADGSDQDMDGDASESSKSPEPVRSKEETTTTTTAGSTSTSATSAAPTTMVTAFIWPHSVMLGGACHHDLSCKDPGAECNFKQCVCRQGFRHKDGVCREQCPGGSFECQTPVDDDIQCISDEERCDSIQQCADGSDEFHCFDLGKEFEGMKANDDNKDEKDEDKEQKIQEEQGHSDSEDSSKKENQQNPEEDNHKEDQSSSEEEKQEENQPSSEEDHETSSKDKEEKNPDSSEEEGDHADVDSSQSTANKTTANKTTSSMSAPTTTTSDGGFVSKTEKSLEMGDLQLPIIALSVGLSFTLFLLIFVACRLRRVRRQLRKGRPLHGNEADYLINGMYL